tara:strand:- start:172 stop:1581 length:1410 start_codon:yes stop_codon:yes gene_type:complete
MYHFITPLWLAGLALLAATGLDWNENMTWYDQHRIEQIGLLCGVVGCLLTIWQRDLTTSVVGLPFWVKLAFAAALGLGWMSAVISISPRYATLEWATMSLLLGMSWLLARQAKTDLSFDQWAIRLIVVLAVVIVLKIMAAYLAATLSIGHLDTILLFEGSFSNRRFFGQVASMIIPLLAYPILRGHLPCSAQLALLALLSLWWMLVIASGTRGTWVALAVAAAVSGAFAWRASVVWLRIQSLAFGIGVLLFGVLFVWLPIWIGLDTSLENRLNNLVTLSGREVLWELAWAQIQAHPWLGIGPMQLAALRNDFGAHPHNAVLQLAAEWGIPAALALLLPLGYGLLRMLVRLRHQGERVGGLLVCLSGSLLAAGVQSMVDGVIVIPYTQTLLVFVAGWALGVYFRDVVIGPDITDSRVWRLGVPVLSMFAVIVLLNGVFPEVLNRAELTQAYVDAGHSLIPPRYWAVGWIP